MRYKLQQWAVKHPRITIMLVLLVLLVAVQGGAAAVDGGVSSNELGSISGGPTDPEGSSGGDG